MLLWIGLAGGCGAVARYLLDSAISSGVHRPWPIGTVLINLTGSLLVGLVAGLALAGSVPHVLQLVLGTGLLGGYTTFSTASFETVVLLRERRVRAALTCALGVLVLGAGAAALGLVIGIALG